MSGFEDREQAFENKFGHDEEIEFKILARAGHAFGLWAAEKLGLKGAEAKAYADACLDVDVAHDVRTAIIAKCAKDLVAKGISVTRHLMEREMEECVAKARRQIAGGKSN